MPAPNAKAILVFFLLFPAVIISSEAQSPDSLGEAGKTISSSRVNTLNKFSFQYGRIEARIKLPKTANGLWPAFWMMGSDFPETGWPGCGEIDIMEMGNRAGISRGTQDRYFNGAAHWGAEQSGGHPNYSRESLSEYSLQDGNFHTFTLIWDEKYIRMFLDNNPDPYFIMDIENEAVRSYFHKPYFIILNLAVGGSFPGIYDARDITALNPANNHEARMYVDFVRVYNTEGTLVWEDDFDTGTINPGKWNIEENNLGGGNRELQLCRKRNVSAGPEPETGSQCLILTARME